jgi:hypothetical protein
MREEKENGGGGIENEIFKNFNEINWLIIKFKQFWLLRIIY